MRNTQKVQKNQEIKATTWEQYQILKWLNQNLKLEKLKIQLLNVYSVKIKDRNNNTAYLSYHRTHRISFKHDDHYELISLFTENNIKGQKKRDLII